MINSRTRYHFGFLTTTSLHYRAIIESELEPCPTLIALKETAENNRESRFSYIHKTYEFRTTIHSLKHSQVQTPHECQVDVQVGGTDELLAPNIPISCMRTILLSSGDSVLKDAAGINFNDSHKESRQPSVVQNTIKLRRPCVCMVPIAQTLSPQLYRVERPPQHAMPSLPYRRPAFHPS